jgi:hypothetical protein
MGYPVAFNPPPRLLFPPKELKKRHQRLCPPHLVPQNAPSRRWKGAWTARRERGERGGVFFFFLFFPLRYPLHGGIFSTTLFVLCIVGQTAKCYTWNLCSLTHVPWSSLVDEVEVEESNGRPLDRSVQCTVLVSEVVEKA